MTTTARQGTSLRTLRGWPLFITLSLLIHLVLLLAWYLFYPAQESGSAPVTPIAIQLMPAPQPSPEPAAVEPPRAEPPATKKAPLPAPKAKAAQEPATPSAQKEPAQAAQPPGVVPPRYDERNMGTSRRLLDTFPDAGGAVVPSPLPAPAPAPAPPGTPPDNDSRLQIESLIRTRFAEHFSYPPLAQSHGWQGEVMLSFLIGIDGTLTHIQVVRSSGHAMLDQAALESMRRIERIEFTPGVVLHHELELHMPVIYRLAQR